MESNQTHIVYDRNGNHQRTIGYRIVPTGTNSVRVICAETRCHPNDNFTKDVARNNVNSRLNSFAAGARSSKLRAFEARLEMAEPRTSSEYRQLEKTLLRLADSYLAIPAALQA